jgi:hypothetical protein
VRRDGKSCKRTKFQNTLLPPSSGQMILSFNVDYKAAQQEVSEGKTKTCGPTEVQLSRQLV